MSDYDFTTACRLCGLSTKEAAELLGIAYQSARDMARKKTRVPPGIRRELAEIYDRMDEAVEEAIEVVRSTTPDTPVDLVVGRVSPDWPPALRRAVAAMVRLRMDLG